MIAFCIFISLFICMQMKFVCQGIIRNILIAISLAILIRCEFRICSTDIQIHFDDTHRCYGRVKGRTRKKRTIDTLIFRHISMCSILNLVSRAEETKNTNCFSGFRFFFDCEFYTAADTYTKFYYRMKKPILSFPNYTQFLTVSVCTRRERGRAYSWASMESTMFNGIRA